MSTSIRFTNEDSRQELDFNDVFSLRKPKDAAAGLASGAKSVAKGVLAGTVGLIAAPAVGASQEGFVGFAKGAAAGIAGAVILPATGIAVGIAQVGRGIANTPQAVRERAKGRHWDRQQRQWVDNPGSALAVDDGAAAHLRRPPANADDVDYYALLGVPQDATSEQIKRAYYLAARRLHPDKNPDDPAAHERFQALAQAYQVLGNDDLRRRYDAHGTRGLDVNFMDGAMFFAALFGSDRFEHIVGELALATAARLGPDLNTEQLQRAQDARRTRLAQLLIALLRRYVEGDEEGFRSSMKEEANTLASASFGETMLRTVGRVYEVQARIQLGGMLEGGFVALKAQGRSIKSQFKAATLAVKVYQKQLDIEKLDAAAKLADKEAEHARARQQRQQRTMEVEESETHVPTDAGDDGALNGHASAAAYGGDDMAALGIEQDPARLAAAAAALHTERVQAEQASLPLMLDAMWAANALDIEATLRDVCRRVLRDASISKAHRLRRAEALLELGRIFKTAKEPKTSKHATTAAERIEAAMREVAEKQMEHR
jgi:curved DNA-binding protein CbpA